MPTPPRRPPLPPPELRPAKPIALRPFGDFLDWLAASRGVLVVSTYNSGKVALLSAQGGVLRGAFWQIPRPMGLAVDGNRLAIASQHHVATYRASPGAGDGSDGSMGLQRMCAYATGRLDAHDLAFDRRGLLFANTKFNCIARPSERVNFARKWQPWFVSKLVRRDCCHLNGVGVCDGRLATVTAFCESDAPAAWREVDRFTSGVLIDVRRNAVVTRGLCMPHSPRWHGGKWWLCNSGEGTLCVVNSDRGGHEPVAALPGFTRGLTWGHGRAVVGLSRIRPKHILDAPPVRKRWPQLRAGASLVDPHSGRETGGVEFVRGGREVYDVAFLPHTSCEFVDITQS